MLTEVKLNLSQAQFDRLKKAQMSGAGINMKLSKDQLKNGGIALKLPKATANKIDKSLKFDKGMVLRVNPKQMRIIEGGAITAAATIASLGMANDFLNDYPAVKNLLSGMGEDIKYLFENPLAISYKFIVSVKIPNLNKRYRDIGIDIETTKKNKTLLGENQHVMKRANDRRVINLENLQGKVGSHIQTLIERIPHIRKMAEERNETLKARQADQLKKQIEATEKKLESLENKKTGAGLQVGNGLQVDGNGIIIDKIKARIIAPLVDKEKKKASAEINKKIAEAKTKAKAEINKKIAEAKTKVEAEARKKLQNEVQNLKADPLKSLGVLGGGGSVLNINDKTYTLDKKMRAVKKKSQIFSTY